MTGRQANAAIYCVDGVTTVSEFKTVKRLVVLAVLLLAGGLSGLAQQTARGLEAPLTFTKNVAPIIFRHCAPCHHPDGPAPFSLMTHDRPRRRPAHTAAATAARYMPPWKPKPGYGAFVGERRLNDAEI